MQLNSPEYDPDIDGQPDPVIDIQSPNAKNIKEDTMSNTANSEQHTALSPNINRPESHLHQFWMILTTQDTKTMNNQGQSRYYAQCQVQKEDIPPLTDVPQLIHQEEANPLIETDKLDKSCKKKYQIFR